MKIGENQCTQIEEIEKVVLRLVYSDIQVASCLRPLRLPSMIQPTKVEYMCSIVAAHIVQAVCAFIEPIPNADSYCVLVLFRSSEVKPKATYHKVEFALDFIRKDVERLLKQPTGFLKPKMIVLDKTSTNNLIIL